MGARVRYVTVTSSRRKTIPPDVAPPNRVCTPETRNSYVTDECYAKRDIKKKMMGEGEGVYKG